MLRGWYNTRGGGGVGGSKMVVFRGKNGSNLGQIWVNFGRFLIIFHDCWVSMGGWSDWKLKCFGNVLWVCVVCGNYFNVLYCQQKIKRATEISIKNRISDIFFSDLLVVGFFCLILLFMIVASWRNPLHKFYRPWGSKSGPPNPPSSATNRA